MELLSPEAILARNLSILRERREASHIMVYTGPGSSHSWLWLASALEGMGFLATSFVEADPMSQDIRPEVLALSGGDAFRMTEAIGETERQRIVSWTERGGLYVGICAGAYLALISRTSPLPGLGLVRAPIANLADEPPPNIAMPERFLVPCGRRHVFQPVRGPVEVEVLGRRVLAPLYGGPCWTGAGDAQPLAHYRGFAEGCTLLTENGLAERTVVGKTAALAKDISKGRALLLGPHFEHPDFPKSHGVIGGALLQARRSKVEPPETGSEAGSLIGLRRPLSEARISYRGLEGATWLIGSKVWEQEKIGLFVNAMWERVQRAEAEELRMTVPEGLEDELRSCVRVIRSIRKDAHLGIDTTESATLLFQELSSAASTFMNSYFEARLRELMG